MERGIVLYSRELSGCLNGIYTNDALDGTVYNEIARKRIPDAVGVRAVNGVYDCFYFDLNNERVNAKLTIDPPVNGMYRCHWQEIGNSTPTFEGFGFVMNEKQFAVYYFPFRPS